MKKIFNLYILCAAILVGCTKIVPSTYEDPNNKSILFNTVRTVLRTKSVDPAVADGFAVYGFYSGNSNWNSEMPISDMVAYIPKDTVYNSGSSWATVHDYYWPKAGKLSFTAWAPVTVDLDVTDTKESLLTKDDYTNNNTDLVIADFASDKTVETSGEDGVHLEFRHALAKVQFNIKAKELDYHNLKFEIKVKSVKIIDTYNTGDFAFNSLNDGMSWTDLKNKQSFTLNSSDINLTTTLDETSLGGAKLYIPQSLATVKCYVKFQLLTKHKGTNELLDDSTFENEFVLKTNSIESWINNHSYVYDIVINPLSNDLITFEPSVVSWTAVNNTISF